MAQFEFDEDKHEYRIDGVAVPSVTEICKPLGADTEDSADLENAMDIASDRGVTCHKVLEMLLNGETDIEYPSAYEPYIDAVRLFVGEHNICPYAIEKALYSVSMSLGGTPDLLADFDGVLSILDYKFVAQIAKSKVKGQLNGYRIMYNELNVYPEQLLAIQFLKDGTYRIYPVAMDDTEFMLCYQLHQLKNKKHARGKID